MYSIFGTHMVWPCRPTWYHQTFITSGHCVVDLLPAYYPFGIFQTFITNGHCVVDLPTSNYRFGILFFLSVPSFQELIE
jgi:hypothetical protein